MSKPYSNLEVFSVLPLRGINGDECTVKLQTSPELMEIFAGGEQYMEFTPEGPEDVELSKQETDYTNYVFMRKNNGWLILHDFIKDALLCKNGYVYTGEEEIDASVREEFPGISEDEMTAVLARKEIELIEHEIVEGPVPSHNIIVKGKEDGD